MMHLDDEPFDAEAVAAGAWDPGPYGAGDTLGTYVEVTDDKRRKALAILDRVQSIATVSLGQPLFVGYPGYGTRAYDQRLVVDGVDPGHDFEGEVTAREPRGRNRMVSLEERITTSYNIGTKVNGLLHVAVGDVAYGGRRVSRSIASKGLVDLGATTWGPPLLTRGLLIDVLALKVEAGDQASLEGAPDGQQVLRGDLRITLEDLHQALDRQGLTEPEPGDAVLIRTGWSHVIHEQKRYMAGSPGIFLRECRWLATRRPALVGSDAWCWGALATQTERRLIGVCHQELMVRHGIRVAESLNLEGLAATGTSEFVLCHNPLPARGAVSSSTPPMAIVDRCNRAPERT